MERTTVSERRRAAALAIATSIALIAFKLALALVTGSVAVLAAAAHSAADLMGSLVSVLGGREADEEPQPTSGAIEGALTIGAAAVVAFASIAWLGNDVDRLALALCGMAVCSVGAALVARRVEGVARIGVWRTLEGDARHLRTDSAASALVAATLGVIALTGIEVLDGLAALAIASLMGWQGVALIRAVPPVEDEIEADEVAAIARALATGPAAVVGYRRLRAGTVAGVRRVEIDVTVRRDTSAVELEEVRAILAQRLARALPEARVLVNVMHPPPPTTPGGGGR